jgi:LysM repeat protein
MVGLFVFSTAPIFATAKGVALHLAPEVVDAKNSQTMALLEAPLNATPSIPTTAPIAIVDNSALTSEGDSGTPFVDAGQSGTGQISVYIVRTGDTLASIAKMFGVSTNTIVWANDLRGNKVSVGDELAILPISGIEHAVAKGDTLQSIAKKYGADIGDILSYNGFTTDTKLSLGQVVIVPDGELSSAPSKPTNSGSGGSSSSVGGSMNSCGLKISNFERLLVNPCSYASYENYYSSPINSGRKTQNLHGYNAVDLAAPSGTAIHAAADGTVIISRNGGYNGGYGMYVVISHPNGTQTLYGHMSKNLVEVGEHVNQGEQIGAVGNTGKSTGAHVHFEIRGARNPF